MWAFRRSQSVVAVVFDPRIEEAFICRYLKGAAM